MKGRFFILLGLMALFAAPVSYASETYVKHRTEIIADRTVEIWMNERISSLSPIIMWSHGMTGCPKENEFVFQALAERGYWIVAPIHKDSRCNKNGSIIEQDWKESFRSPEKWNEETYKNRGDDIREVFEAIKSDKKYNIYLDFNRVALGGYSLGGYTVLGLGGGWESWKMDNIKAVLTFSPYSEPYNYHKKWDNFDHPVMFQGGTLDPGITQNIRKSEGSYMQASSPKFFIEFDKAGHFAWTPINKDHHAAIVKYSIAFLDQYVRGLDNLEVLTTRENGVASFAYDLGNGDKSEIEEPGKSEERTDNIREKIRERLGKRLAGKN